MRTDATTPAVNAPATASPAVTQAAAGVKVAVESVAAPAVEKVTPPADVNAAVRAAARQIDSYLKSIGREVEFHVDDETGTTVITVRETATGDVIRQIPNEEVLQLARRFSAGSGSLLDLKV